MKSIPLILATLLSLGATTALAAEPPTAELPPMRAASDSLSTQLAGDLKKELSTNGPVSAIQICRDKAPAIAGELSRKNGWKVTRVSLLPRNTLLGMPDAWEQGVLIKMQEQLSAGADPKTLEVVEIVQEPAGRFLRYMKGMPIQPLCLTCHGDAGTMAPAMKDKLATDYPNDRATGYKVGMLRGAVSIKKPLAD